MIYFRPTPPSAGTAILLVLLMFWLWLARVLAKALQYLKEINLNPKK